VTFSRRTWLWTSTAALAAACARPEATRLPEGGAEGPRELKTRGAENLIALAELGAAIRWLHPSDRVVETEWEPLMLDGVRGLEGARTRTELVEGLRGLFGEVAPTVVIWRGRELSEGDALDGAACPDPDAKKTTDEKPEPEKAPVEEPKQDSPPEPAAEPEPAEPAEPDEGEVADEAETTEATPEPEPEKPEAEKPEPKPEPKPQPAKPDPDAKKDDRPPLPEALSAPDEQLAIIQWQRRGYVDARRIELLPGSERPLAPGAPMRIELPRGLSSMVPLALWSREGRTLPATNPLELAPSLDETQAQQYTLDDRGTRLLAVLRTWSLLRRFYPHPTADLQPLLLASLCAAADDPSPVALRATLERLLAGFGDGNAELIVTTGKAARRFVPLLSLAWAEQRVVVAVSLLEGVQRGDVVTAIDGVSIDTVLAERLLRTPAATSSAAIVRTVAGLLAREHDGAAITLSLARDDSELELSVSVVAEHRAARLLADGWLNKPISGLADYVYVDATRLPSLPRADRRLRRAARVVIDLRGELADPRGSWLAHFIDEPRVIALERMPTGPDPSGAMPLEQVGELRVEPARPRLTGRPVILADARTRGRAELELAGFDQLGATVIGSASAGDLGGVATAWLPGGWQLRFTHSELRNPDGSTLYGVGVRPSIPVEPTRESLRKGADPLFASTFELGPRK
jgi:hypothetical protein